MRKLKIHPLAVITLVFALFTAGFFAGRNYNRSDVQIRNLTSRIPAATISLGAENETTLEADAVEGQININTASKEQLALLPGIGETYSENILAYREQHGPFPKAEDLLNVDGIGPARLEAILDYITVGGLT